MAIELLPALTGFTSVVVAKYLYNRLLPSEAVLWAMEFSRRYKALEREASRSKRAAKKLKELKPEASRARSILFRSVFLKVGILMLSYTVLGVLALLVAPAVPSPYSLPFITVDTPSGPMLPSLYSHFFIFIYAALLYRDEMV
ncbi:MAG: hypothetical protein F7B20_06080 [Aeropyrum sp.]|nr:hypothetical protein [Aeropyrum sp.]MCE4616245.1 hypothetical protein [Aeropyrum sp.]